MNAPVAAPAVGAFAFAYTAPTLSNPDGELAGGRVTAIEGRRALFAPVPGTAISDDEGCLICRSSTVPLDALEWVTPEHSAAIVIVETFRAVSGAARLARASGYGATTAISRTVLKVLDVGFRAEVAAVLKWHETVNADARARLAEAAVREAA